MARALISVLGKDMAGHRAQGVVQDDQAGAGQHPLGGDVFIMLAQAVDDVRFTAIACRQRDMATFALQRHVVSGRRHQARYAQTCSPDRALRSPRQ